MVYMVWAYRLSYQHTEYMVWYKQPPIYKGAYHTEYLNLNHLVYTRSIMKPQLPMSHDRIQQEIYNYLHNAYPQTRGTCWHTPNEFIPDTFVEGQLKKVYAKTKLPDFMQNIFNLAKKHFVSQLAKRKAIGVLKGVTDLVMYHRGVLLMMDIKLPGDTLSDAQQAFIDANIKQGGKFIEINTLEQGKRDIDNFFNLINQHL